MKYLALVTLIFTIACGRVETIEEFFDITGDSGKDGQSCVVSTVEGGSLIECPNSSSFVPSGDSKKDLFSVVEVAKGECKEVVTGIYVENIRGDLYDVYSNDKCKDKLGEYCDNVVPSFGNSGKLTDSELSGSATLCFAENYRLSASKSATSGGLIILIEDFNE
tara:strand:- start:1285 stop:1776 length:492 start_codon:yes stop_codon:yes gene_type:complete